MKSLLAVTFMFALAACGEVGDDAEIDMSTAPAAPVEALDDGLPPPDSATFSAALAEACPDAPSVSTSLCKATGMGSETFVCEYGLGEDEYMRYSATLEEGEDSWVVTEPDAVCAQGTQ